MADTIARLLDQVSAARSVRGSQTALYVAPRLRPYRWLVAELGARYDRTSWTGDASLSPRANVMLTLTPATTLRLAVGRYAQSQEVFALQVQDGVTAFGREDVAEHRVVGIEQRVGLIAMVRVEAYERRIIRQEPRYINLRGDLRVFPELEPDRVLLSSTSGRAHGVELSVRGLGRGGVDWAAGYTYSRVTDR
ncbi:MAG: TonB-dependent receptor [Gemmatimonadetes bacterium]|nr:TonB-dependent receptor [Gemmatimonadota bacterium]